MTHPSHSPPTRGWNDGRRADSPTALNSVAPFVRSGDEHVAKRLVSGGLAKPAQSPQGLLCSSRCAPQAPPCRCAPNRHATCAHAHWGERRRGSFFACRPYRCRLGASNASSSSSSYIPVSFRDRIVFSPIPSSVLLSGVAAGGVKIIKSGVTKAEHAAPVFASPGGVKSSRAWSWRVLSAPYGVTKAEISRSTPRSPALPGSTAPQNAFADDLSRK